MLQLNSWYLYMCQKVPYIYVDGLVHDMVVDYKLCFIENLVYPIVLPISYNVALKGDHVVNL